jgi:serine/threonine protein phosphatase PrpC
MADSASRVQGPPAEGEPDSGSPLRSAKPRERAVLLRGRDYAELGQLAAVDLPGGGAIALTRGAQPKAYAHVDPNEDGALVLDTPGGSLIAVVDGHNGRTASELALDAVREAGVELLRDDDRAFRQSVEAVIARVVDQLRSAPQSRTCLLLATLIGGRCRWATFGDSVLLRGTSAQPVTRPNSLVLRPDLPVPPDDRSGWTGAFTLGNAERVAVMTDGVTNFVGDLDRVRVLLSRAPANLDAARDIAAAAMRAGAGDNVAVATCTQRSS